MFSKLIDKRQLQSRKLLFCLTTLVLWALQMAFLSLMLLSVKYYLHQVIERELESSMTLFIQQNQNLISLPDVYAPVFDENSLSGLNFVRIIKNNEQLLYSTSADDHLDFRSLAELDPHQSGSWLPLFKDDSDEFVWNILSVSPVDNFIIQVGSRDHYLHRMYTSLVHFLWMSIVPSLIVSALLAYVGFRLSLLPLNYLAERLLTVQTDKEGLLEVSSDGRIIDKTVKKMHTVFSSEPVDLQAFVSPSLGPCCAEFIHYREELPGAFHAFQVKPSYFNFWEITRRQLTGAGLANENIEISGICTSCSNDYFSYRRACRNGDGRTGRHCAVISLQSMR